MSNACSVYVYKSIIKIIEPLEHSLVEFKERLHDILNLCPAIDDVENLFEFVTVAQSNLDKFISITKNKPVVETTPNRVISEERNNNDPRVHNKDPVEENRTLSATRESPRSPNQTFNDFFNSVYNQQRSNAERREISYAWPAPPSESLNLNLTPAEQTSASTSENRTNPTKDSAMEKSSALSNQSNSLNTKGTVELNLESAIVQTPSNNGKKRRRVISDDSGDESISESDEILNEILNPSCVDEVSRISRPQKKKARIDHSNRRGPHITTKDLFDAGYIKQGDVLSYGKYTTTVDGRGFIGNGVYNNPSAWVTTVAKKSYKYMHGWTEVKRGNTPLSVLKQKYYEENSSL